MLKSTMTAAATIALAACQTAPAQQPTQQPAAPSLAPQQTQAAEQPPAEDIDLFTLAIETGRWQVMIDRAREGVREAPSLNDDEDLILRSDASLKSAALDLLQLRNEACAKGLASPRICTFIDWPAWTLERPTADIDPATLQQRSDWLGEALGEWSVIGCNAGEAATGDERFCAVE